VILHSSPVTPYGRKCAVVLLEAGLADRVAVVRTNPWADTDRLRPVNPLSKIPALELPDGRVLVDSAVICEFLDAMHAGPPLFPPPGDDRWTALTLQAVADGILDAAMLRFNEVARRTPEQRSQAWLDRQRAAMEAGLDRIEATAGWLAARPFSIGHAAVASLLGYHDLRWRAEDFRTGRPRLAVWWEEVRGRPSLAATAPEDLPADAPWPRPPLRRG